MKRARQLNDPLLWDDYRRLRNNNDEWSQSWLLLKFIPWSKIRCCLLETTQQDIRNNKSKETNPLIKEGRWKPYNRWHWKGYFHLNDYFCTVAEKLIRPADEIPPLHAHGRENVDTPTMTSITISQMVIEEKICTLKVKKATRPDGVSARLLKYAGMSIAPSLTRVFKQSVEACKLPDQWKRARVRARVSTPSKKVREEDRTCYRPLSMLSVYQVNEWNPASHKWYY